MERLKLKDLIFVVSLMGSKLVKYMSSLMLRGEEKLCVC